MAHLRPVCLMKHELSTEERDLVLAALRLWQSTRPSDMDPEIRLIASDGDSHPIITLDEIDELCERLNVGDPDSDDDSDLKSGADHA